MTYELFYWPGIPGRGEFVRLAFEATGTAYRDVCREEGTGEMFRLMDAAGINTPSFAPPILRDGDVIVGQAALILHFLGPRLGLVPENEMLRFWTHQIQLTIVDFVAEIHDTHHPVGGDFYYEEQKREALRRAGTFRNSRLPKFFGWFESIIKRNASGWLVGDEMSYVDLSLFLLVEGLTYGFPKTVAKAMPDYPLIASVHDMVAALPRIATYLKSTRRQAFNEDGIFRFYPELEDA